MSRTTKVDLSKGAHLNEPQRNDPEDPKEVLDRLAPRGQQQEWTPEYLYSIGIFTTEQMCDAHNAELAAERERREQAEEQLALSSERSNPNIAIGTIENLKQQLAAERELAEIGSRWRKDSSLETWFPFTAKELAELKQQLAAERQRREQAERLGKERLHQLACYLEGNPYSDPDFIADSPALKAAVKLREQFLSALAAIGNDALKAPWTDVGQILSPIDLSAMHEHDTEVRSKADKDWREQVAELITEHEQELAEVREPLVSLLCEIRLFLNRYRNGVVEHAEANSFASRIDDALVKVKEGK